ncbi:MAG: hypothetical protein M1817_003605 [Caeruleum heppii]|nr:MAG: hypothetical protein M1817_003605 [Caeruleum heppii]
MSSTDSHQEKEYHVHDPQAAPHDVNRDEPINTEPLQHVTSQSPSAGIDESEGKGRQRVERYQTQTTISTTASALQDVDSDLENSTPPRSWKSRLNPFRSSRKPPVPKERQLSPEHGASFWSRLTFQWMSPLMRVGYQRSLEVNDIWKVNPDRSTETMAERLNASFRRRVSRGDKYPLLWAMHETFKKEFWIGGLCQLMASILQVMAPFALRYLIAFAGQAYRAQRTGGPAPNIGSGLGLAFGVTLTQVLQSLGTNHFIFRGMMVGGESRAVLMVTIFEKAMKLSGRAKAGGRAIEDGAKVDAAAEQSSDKKGQGPKASPDKAPGIAGDGMGWGNGRVVNLMATDTYRIDQASGMFHIIWTAPVSMVICLVVLLINITYSALAGFGLLVIGTPVLTKVIGILLKRRTAINHVTDQRVGLTQEILQAVRFVKYFGWESAFLGRLREIRQREIHAIQVVLAIRNAINAVSMSLPIFASMLSFVTYALTDHPLDPARIFSSLALFNSLRLPLNLLPLVIGQVIDGWSSIRRIQEFLLAEEMKDEFQWSMQGEFAVEAKNASFTWERTATQDPDRVNPGEKLLSRSQQKKAKKRERDEQHEKSARPSGDGLSDKNTDSASTLTAMEPFKIHDLNFAFGRKELIAVVGGVGSGKSSLLAALAGDMRKINGEVTMGASRAFCPQYAWIQNTTVRENILFGKDYDPVWYSKVIDACALRPDLDMLPNGDQTEIGERGITISGGQKQRLNIARAIYFDAEMILMDDPLSAVDAHVGRHMFDEAISGLLKDKCRILATHQLHVLSRCDRIVWIHEGRIEAFDTFDNLMAKNDGFAKMMVSTAVEEEQIQDHEADDHDDVEDEKKRAKKSKKSKKGAALMQAEERAVKSVPWSVYSAYIKASGTIWNGPLLILLLIISQGANIVTSLWLSFWTSNKFGFSTPVYIGVYAALGVCQALLMFIFSVTLTVIGTTASKVMLNRAMTRVLRAPLSFFDTTPLGRITNRFSKDVDTLDNTLTDSIRMYFFTMAMIISVFILIIAFFPYFAIALVPLFLVFVFSANYYRASARELKRHESVLRSVVFARFGEGLSGTASIRAYGTQERFIKGIRDAVDEMDGAYFLTFSNQRWLSVRLDLIGTLLVLTTGILVVTSRFNVSPSIAGLVLSYILSIVQMIQFTVRQLAEVENGMNATERVHYYGTELEEEAPLELQPVRDAWPERGEIVFQDVQMRYREGLPLVLKGLSMHVGGGERIGVVGRTGAGKSSIMSTLFRLVELSGGSITIDGVDIAQVGLQDLRSRLAIIPQDPTLFRGTIRSNLDPFNEHTDLELWSALRQSDLVSADATLDDKSPGRIHLDGVVEEEGLNFSLGQRQLMALARALVRNSQVIVCDEATSSVDVETDQKIQCTMATGFRGKTLLCIAHRLRTIIHYDRICVMEAGRIAELDSPLNLYDQDGGIFRGMCDRSGIRRGDFLADDEA